MPLSPTPDVGVRTTGIEISTSDPASPAATGTDTNTRALLESLEELRDSLSVRVGQLATAVERLRTQAGQLERSVDQSEGSRRSFSDSLTTDAHQIPIMPPSEQSHITTSAIASELSSLDRPITSAEIHRLLDRASASLAATPDLFAAEMEGTLGGLREVRTSLQGGLRDLTEMGETQTRLRQRMRARWERASTRPVDEVERGGANARGGRETMQQEAQRRLAEIEEAARAHRSERRGEKKRAAKAAAEKRAARSAKPSIIISPPTISTSSRQIIVRNSGVEPPPINPTPSRLSRRISGRAAPAPIDPTETVNDGSATVNSTLSHLNAASLDTLHTQIAELDLNLEPTEYMNGLSRIIRQAIHPHSTPAIDRVDMMIMDESGNILHDSLPGWGPPHSPSSTSSSDHTVIEDNPDAGLTYRGRDVQDRIRATATTPDLGGLLGQDTLAVRALQDRVARIMARRPDPRMRTPEQGSIPLRTRRNPNPPLPPTVQPVPLRLDDPLSFSRSDRIQRARDIVQDSSRSVQDAARSARELVNAATSLREDVADRHSPTADREIAYELSVQSELRAAQAHRSRVYNRYQDLVASQARREARPPPALMAIPPPPPTGRDLGSDAVISVIHISDPTLAEHHVTDLDQARQQFISAQMREAAVQQRLIWARSRLRRETPREPLSTSERIADLRLRFQQIEETSADLMWPAGARVTAGQAGQRSPGGPDSEGENDVWESTHRIAGAGGRESVPSPRVVGGGIRRTVGPRDERPEDVDTMVRIRQLQNERPSVLDRSEARRRHLSAIRQDLASSRQRIREAGGESNTADAAEDEGDPSLRQLLDDARQLSDARQSLYDSLDQPQVTPSSPITASGHADYSHVHLSVGNTSSAIRQGDRDWMGDGDEAVRRIVENVLGEPGQGSVRAGGELSSGETAGGSDNPLQSPRRDVQIPVATTGEGGEEAGDHSVQEPVKQKRRERVYISMLDL